LINSIAPSIYGHKDIKTAIALSLFGGVLKRVRSKSNRFRNQNVAHSVVHNMVVVVVVVVVMMLLLGYIEWYRR